ncbi:hypothetical protein OPT61_g343 [Boeremia exigua]|uniref:Uncharacterized protein n=1 Tax=Boeremia exigua TaxID=749465 RepID=A0ACC2IU42_9PLEO|nr:hypothetical protein OPT61_g343 [Boeremia exigua]
MTHRALLSVRTTSKTFKGSSSITESVTMSAGMSPLANKLNNEITSICKKIGQRRSITIILDNKKHCKIGPQMLKRLRTGSKLTASDWRRLLDLLVRPKAAGQKILVQGGHDLPEAEFDDHEPFILIHKLSKGDTKSSSTAWCITACNPTSNTVNTYAVGYVEGERKGFAQIAAVFDTQQHTIRSTYHQETSSCSDQHVPYSDAILLDMLLDIVAGEFSLHDRSIDDGLAFQLEILQAIEERYVEAEAADAILRASAMEPSVAVRAPKRKRVPIGDRLKERKEKKVKTELPS